MFRTPVELIPPFTRDLMDKVCENCDWPNNDYTLFMTAAALFLHFRKATTIQSILFSQLWQCSQSLQ